MISLKPHVAIVPQGKSVLIIDQVGDVPTVKLAASQLNTLVGLKSGQGEALQPELHKLLSHYGFLEGSQASPEAKTRRPSGQIILPNPDAFLKVVVMAFRLVPSAMWRLFFYCAMSYALVMSSIWLWQVNLQVLPLQPLWLLAYLVFTIVGHELSHGLVMRYHHLPISSVGINLKAKLFPTPFVATKCIPLLNSKRDRASIAIAGPAWDLVMLGSILTVQNHFSDKIPADIQTLLPWLALIQLAIFTMNITPFQSSDGFAVAKHFFHDLNGEPSHHWKRFLVAYKWLYSLLILVILPTLFLRQWY